MSKSNVRILAFRPGIQSHVSSNVHAICNWIPSLFNRHGIIFLTSFLALKNNEVYILMEARLMMLFKNPQQYEILEKFPGKTLGGRKYEPLFPYFAHVSFHKTHKSNSNGVCAYILFLFS